MSGQYMNLDFGSEVEYGSNLPVSCCPSPDTLSWLDQCLSDIPSYNNNLNYINFPDNSMTHGENVEIIHDTFMGNNNNNGKATPDNAAHQVVSKKLFCFADGHILDPQRVDLFCLDLSKRAYQLTIHRQNGFDSFSLKKVVAVSDLFQSLKEYLSSKVRLMFLIDEEYSLLTDELNFKVTAQPQLQMEVQLAFSLQNLIRSTMRYAISQSASSRKTNSLNVKSFVVCEFENELFRDQNAQSIQSFIPCGSNTELSPCWVASVVYSLYLCGEVHEDFTILGSVFDIASSFCSSSSSASSSVNFSYRKEHHSSPGHSQDNHSHGTLSLSPLVPSEESPVECFKIVYCPQRAQSTSKGHRSTGINKQSQYGFSPYLDSAVVQRSSNGREMLLEAFDDSSNASHESQEVIVDGQTNIQNKRKKSSAPWSAARLISLEDLKQHYGKKREEAAESLQVSVSTLKRRCRDLGVRRWPPVKRKKEDHLFTARRCNARIAEVRTSQLPQNGMSCQDIATTSVSRQKRKMKEKEADNVDVINHFEEQPSAILNCTPKRQAVDCATKVSSSYNSIAGTIEGINSVSTSVQPLHSTSCDENIGQKTKLLFDNLIALPLEELIDPGNETSMKKTLSILEHNLSLFSEEQAEQILELSFDFPTFVHSWRKCSGSQMYNQKSFAETEKIRDLVETSVKDEESLKVRYEELESKEKELMAQLEAVQKEKAGIADQRNEKSMQTKHLVSLAEEKEASRSKETYMMKIATTKLKNLADQWTKIQSLFI